LARPHADGALDLLLDRFARQLPIYRHPKEGPR
jgi:hypothetical protein